MAVAFGNAATYNPITWCEAPSGLLFGANGLDYIIKWDGLAANAWTVGLFPPTVGPTMNFSGAGNISGAYLAVLRWVDDYGNFSNASPVAATTTTATNALTLQYTALQRPADLTLTNVDQPHYVRRQILRTTAGESTQYYVDIDTTDITSTALYSDRNSGNGAGNVAGTAGNINPASANTDADLSARLASSVLATDLFLNGRPPAHKAVIANHLGRMFAAVDAVYDEGSIQVTNGSTTINLTGGHFLNGMSGRALYVTGASQVYTIASLQSNLISPGQTQAFLTIPYADATDQYTTYAIRPQPSERRLIYFSRANLPESWPSTNSIAVQEDGDDITGLMPFGSFLYILERKHVYRFTFQTDPISDGFIYLTLNRGCLNQRCWITVEGTAYMLDDQGVHAYKGARDSDPISSPIQDLFRFSDSPYRVNWAAQKWFHAVHFSSQEVIRWFVALAGSYLPYHAICYNYRQNRWWIEEWATQIGGSVLGRLGKTQKLPQVYLGTSAARPVAMWQGTLDGPDPNAGTVRGPVTGTPYVDVFPAGGSTFATSNLIDNPISIVDGKGKGQQNIVVTVNNPGAIQVKHPWRILPDTTSVFQLGGIQWKVQFGWWRWLMYEQENERFITVVAQTCANPCIATIQMFTDFSNTPVTWRGDWTLNAGAGVRTVPGSADIDLDMTKKSGYWQKRLPGHREFFTDGVRYVSFRLSGVTNTDYQRIYYVTAGGADQGG